MVVCSGCSLLCDDIEVVLDSGRIGEISNICRKGLGRFRAVGLDRTDPRIDGNKSSYDDAILAAADLLRSSKRPLLFGWSNSTLEAQRQGIELARKLRGVIDDTSSFCQGILVEKVLTGELPTCTLDDVRDYADVVIFWGADPSSSHPRHLSRFSYFPRGKKRQKGYEEERTAICIDVRESPTAKICAENYIKIPQGGDAAFAEALLNVLGGKIPKVADKKRMLELGSLLKKAEYGVIFGGLGLVYSMKDDIGLLGELLSRLNEVSKFYMMPMVGHYNMRGFNQTLYDETGHINRVSFADSIESGPEYGIVDALKICDAALVIGSDPISSLPAHISRMLAKVPIVAIDPHRTLTTEVAKVVIPAAFSGLEAGGSALRMDGLPVKLEPILSSDYLSDAEILKRLLEAV
jgi:formylmethanofuran dehydrogenase subunit B